MNQLKVFTLEETNRLLPVLSGLISDLHAKRDRVADIEVEIDALELVNDHTGEAVPEGLERLVEKHRETITEFYEVVEQIHSYGCFLKDVNLGLIDFYGMVDGQVVYLCWRFGEDRVGFWHEIGSGYTDRKPLI
ncbi:MAG: hypothetical protein A3C35_03130 [Omnitrophica bacterium RIFCSPHIGHO2_02_FULL_46_11]|nr:MAG: hypothetical protein A3A81_06365 [Omnitrophica bacterium RIFCSPLOWO2_01_FULL_45_10b]OGW87948.1 MAG: hypothetical protein A3C35_03130 [Omnitrophica bacterium RIFCSPHIGHO2_02_FULL_46_11]